MKPTKKEVWEMALVEAARRAEAEGAFFPPPVNNPDCVDLDARIVTFRYVTSLWALGFRVDRLGQVTFHDIDELAYVVRGTVFVTCDTASLQMARAPEDPRPTWTSFALEDVEREQQQGHSEWAHYSFLDVDVLPAEVQADIRAQLRSPRGDLGLPVDIRSYL